MENKHADQATIERLLTDPQPGIYENIPFKIYRGIKAVNNSKLGRLDHCPAAINQPDEDTRTLQFGRALHTYCLEGAVAFFAQYAIAPEVDKRTKEGKARWAAFQAENLDKMAIDPDEYETILGMHASLQDHPYAKILMKQGVGERTLIWRHDETGHLCKCRADWTPGDDHGIVLDLKGLAEVNENYFLRAAIGGYGYARAAAFYLDGTSIATGKQFKNFNFICCEKAAPYKVEIYTMEDDILAWGRGEYYRLMRQLKRLEEEGGKFPAYVHGGSVSIFLPQWLQKQ